MASNPGKVSARSPRKPLALPAPTTEGAAPAAAALAEETVMDTTTAAADATAEARTMFADASERARSGFAQGQSMLAEMGEFSKGNLEAMVESSRIAARGFEALGRDAAAFLRGQVEDAQAQARSLSAITSPTDLLKVQSDFARASFDKLVAETSRGTEAMLKLAGEVAQPISNRLALAADKIKVVA